MKGSKGAICIRGPEVGSKGPGEGMDVGEVEVKQKKKRGGGCWGDKGSRERAGSGWGLMRIRGRRREDHRGRGFVMLNCLS